MGKLLRRRNMIIQAKASPSGALYRLWQGQISASSGNGLININGNHIDTMVLVNGGGVLAFVNGTTYWESDTTVDPWFTIPSGSVVTLKLKNITYNNPASSANRQSVILRSANKTNIVTSGTITFAKNSQGTKADIEVASAVLNSDTAVGAVRFQTTYGISATASFDVELWVDDVRYL